MLYFITGNKNKFQEFQEILGKDQIEQLDIDLPELQEIDPYKIIRHKLQEALKHHSGPLVIEDTSFSMECLGGSLPGPLIKRFLQELKPQGLYELAAHTGKYGAKAMTIIGYATSANDIYFFEGTAEGTILAPLHTGDFGWGVMFCPQGHKKSYGAMTKEEKNRVSMRRIAINKLKEFLKNDEK